MPVLGKGVSEICKKLRTVSDDRSGWAARRYSYSAVFPLTTQLKHEGSKRVKGAHSRCLNHTWDQRSLQKVVHRYRKGPRRGQGEYIIRVRLPRRLVGVAVRLFGHINFQDELLPPVGFVKEGLVGEEDFVRALHDEFVNLGRNAVFGDDVLGSKLVGIALICGQEGIECPWMDRGKPLAMREKASKHVP